MGVRQTPQGRTESGGPELGRTELVLGLPVVASKLVPPPLPKGFTHRPRVVAALSKDESAFWLVQAPAGYGKTMAVVEALAGEPRDVAWLSIDAYDSTELSFWAHLAASIDLVRPGLLRVLLDSDWRTPEFGGIRLVASLLSALPSDDDLIVVLDDLHQVKSRTLWEQLAFFLERSPPGIRVVCTARSVTPLPVERWLSQGRATVIDEQVLKFSPAEAGRLIKAVSQRDVPSGEAAELVARSEGWAVGLLFEALTRGKAAPPEGAVTVASPRPTATVNYLATEVLDTLSAEDRRFLLSISVLDEFDNELCRQVTGEPDAGERLRSLQVANLFLVPVGDDVGRFRFHHLFRELLLEELDRRDPDRRVELHRRAAEAAGASHEVPVQIHHLIEAGDHSAAFDLMVLHARMGSLATARELISKVPTDFVRQDPSRMLDFATVNIEAGDWVAGEQWCDRVEATLADATGPLRARLDLHRSWIHGVHGDAPAALAKLESSFAAGIRDDVLYVGLATASVARLHVLLTRDRQAASFWLEEVGRLPPEYYLAHQETTPALMGFLRFWSGDLDAAERLARQLLGPGEQPRLHPGIALLEALLVLTDVLIETARLSEAMSTLERAERLARRLAGLGYLVHGALRRIELTAATRGPAAGADAAAEAKDAVRGQHLGATLTDALDQRHAYWLLAEGRTIEASRLIENLTPGPPRSVLSAKLDSVVSHGASVADIVGDTHDWPLPERLEAELIADAADGYRRLPEILENGNGFIWTVVKQGPALLRRLASLSPDAHSAATNVLHRAGCFDAAFRPAEVAGPGGHLTDRERALLRLLPSHLTYAGIATELCLSVNTVKANLKTLYGKLGATSRSEAVQRAQEAELS